MGWGRRLNGISRHNSDGYDILRLGRLTVRVKGNWFEILVLSHDESRSMLLMMVI